MSQHEFTKSPYKGENYGKQSSFKLHKVKKHWITIVASSLAIGASLIGLGQIGADEVKPETTAVNSPENVVSDSNLETSASLITRTEVAPASTVVENTSSEQHLLTLHLLMSLSANRNNCYTAYQ
ncbi:MAG: KxYKxGKxW signal peptide domain-containing protein [Streptococcus salivarius]